MADEHVMAEMERWLDVALPELGLSREVLSQAKDPILDVVRDIAHGVSRPAAPLTAFLVGLSAGLSAPSKESAVEAVLATVERVNDLVADWVPRAEES